MNCDILCIGICYIQYIPLIWKESLNIDGQQSHQYQQNEQSPLTSKTIVGSIWALWLGSSVKL